MSYKEKNLSQNVEELRAAETDIQGRTIDDVIPKTDKRWYTQPHFIRLNLAIFLITLSSTTQGYDGSMLNGLQSLETWQKSMGHPKGHILGALANGTLFGGVAVAPLAPWINDKFGRRIGILVGSLFCVIGAILQGLSTNYAFFMCSRIIIGFSGIGNSAAALISEIAYPSQRSVATSMYNVCWYLGALIASSVTFGTKDMHGAKAWRIPSYVQGALPLVQVLLIWLIPESPRYLISKGRVEDARKMLTSFHVGNDTSPEAMALIDFEISEIEVALEMEKIQAATRYRDFFSTPGNRKRLFLTCFIPVMMQLSGNALVSYYLSLVLNSIGITTATEQLRINVALMGYNLGISIVAAAVTNRLKRRFMFLTSLGMMMFCYIVWTALSAINQKRNFEDKGLGKGVLAMIFLYYLSYDFGMNGLPFAYLTEVLSYSLRAKGLTIFGIIGSIIGVFSGFVNPIAMDAIEWKYYIVYCCVLACEIPVVYFFFPETSGYSLEEVAEVFGDDPQDTHHIIDAIRSEKASMEHVEHA